MRKNPFALRQKAETPAASRQWPSQPSATPAAPAAEHKHTASSSPSSISATQTSSNTGSWVDEILFPRVYEEAWGIGSADSRTDLDRARIFLVRFGTMSSDAGVAATLRATVADPSCNGSVLLLAAAAQHRLLGTAHASFATSPLVQAVRFMLIKTRVPDTPCADPDQERTRRALMDFFFDPVLARNTVPPPPPATAVKYLYPTARLKVAIVGGGPTALASAISLAEKGKGKVEVHVWERRWMNTTFPDGSPRVDWPATARRRDQVVTLQESVTTLLSDASRHALFAGRPERVWPGSANIQIRKVEDRLLLRCHDEEFGGLIHLHPRAITRETLGEVGDFHVLLGADGAASWVRRVYFQGYEHERGRSYALGLAFDRPQGLPWSQPLNMFLTLGQTRYLLNASNFDGRGYLNMQLTEEEWHRMLAVDGEPVTFGHPGCLRRPDGSLPAGFTEGQVFAPSENRDGPLWRSIEDGLKLFGFKESEVINVVRIPIIVQAIKEGVHILHQTGEGPSPPRRLARPHALVAVAGDAAMTVHFWPGRGLNSGIKSGLALGDEIVHALDRGLFVGLPLSAMREYNDFILKLQDREHDKRSIPILNQSGTPETLGWLLSKAPSVPDEVAVEWLVGAMGQIAERLQQRGDWAFPPLAGVEAQLRIVLRQLHSDTLREMAVSFPWPTREMGGAEVLPARSMRPEEKQRWLAQLWGLLREERKRDPSSASATADEVRAARFEAPRQKRAPSPQPLMLAPPLPPQSPPSPSSTTTLPAAAPDRAATLRRSNATRAGSVHVLTPAAPATHVLTHRFSVSTPTPMMASPAMPSSPAFHYNEESPDGPSSRTARGRNVYDNSSLTVPGSDQSTSVRSTSPGPAPTGDVALGRLLSVNRRPGKAMLSDALSLALFRVDGAD